MTKIKTILLTACAACPLAFATPVFADAMTNGLLTQILEEQKKQTEYLREQDRRESARELNETAARALTPRSVPPMPLPPVPQSAPSSTR